MDLEAETLSGLRSVYALFNLEAENYTESIAAKRSFSLYGLECPNPKLLMVYEGVRVRSVEVD